MSDAHHRIKLPPEVQDSDLPAVPHVGLGALLLPCSASAKEPGLIGTSRRREREHRSFTTKSSRVERYSIPQKITEWRSPCGAAGSCTGHSISLAVWCGGGHSHFGMLIKIILPTYISLGRRPTRRRCVLGFSQMWCLLGTPPD